jgi:hypothetical protein
VEVEVLHTVVSIVLRRQMGAAVVVECALGRAEGTTALEASERERKINAEVNACWLSHNSMARSERAKACATGCAQGSEKQLAVVLEMNGAAAAAAAGSGRVYLVVDC